MQKPLNKELQDFLIDRCDQIDFEMVSPQFKGEEAQIDQIYKEIRENLSDEDRTKFLRLNDLHGYRMTSAANAAYIRGYSECLECILYLLTSK